MTDRPEIKAGRLAPAEYERNFVDVKPSFTPTAALVEAARCHFCYDAPCVAACPTGIDIPQFIAKISTGNTRGAATEILSENIFGGACARVCPTEVLCEEVCVRMDQETRPVQIGRLQRYATDFMMSQGGQPFSRGAPTGRRIAIVGAGPAGLSCAHRLAMHGHEAVVFDARAKAGGLNEYGIAAYKVPDDFAQKELAFILDIGGVELRTGQTLGSDVKLADLQDEYDAVFIAVGLGAARNLAVEGGDLNGVLSAVDYISDLRQASNYKALPVADKIVVIGGGNTAIDIAAQSKCLGAEEVTIAYRRGPDEMSATRHEQDFAQTNGVVIRHWVTPHKVIGKGGNVVGIELERTQLDDKGNAVGTGKFELLDADIIFAAMGQVMMADALMTKNDNALEMIEGRISIDETMMTSVPGIFAGGDCVKSGQDLTVQSVQDGKVAAAAINSYLSQ